ncbi:MAG: hypothetical protein ACRENS_05855 [Candidatus Eiseniibacteriota bacterium]
MGHSLKRDRHGLLRVRTRGRSWILGLSRALPLALALAFAAGAHAGGNNSNGPRSRVIAARVIWVRDARLYLASADSIVLDPGARLLFRWRGKTIATAEVEQVLDGHLIAARASSGKVEEFHKPERLEVRLAEDELGAWPLLRVGIPAGTRANLLVSCDPPALQAPPVPGGYRAEALVARGFRLVREAPDSAGAPWPDTLLVLQFAEAADEEIALERAEIDVGVFWPGELSAAMRQRAPWQEFLLGNRARGALCVADDSGTVPPAAAPAARASAAAMEALNRDRFRGDLLTCSARDSAAGEQVQFRVESSIPGHAELERLLNRYAATAATGSATRVLRVFEANRSDEAPPVPAGSCALRIRCPVVCAPARRAYVRALGADAFAELPGCPAKEAGP